MQKPPEVVSKLNFKPTISNPPFSGLFPDLRRLKPIQTTNIAKMNVPKTTINPAISFGVIDCANSFTIKFLLSSSRALFN